MNWKETATQIRLKLQALGPCRPGRRVPHELRSQIIEHFQARPAIGCSQAAAAHELGTRLNTILRWMRSYAQPPPRLRSVLISSPTPTDTPVLVLPSGARVEGLTLQSLADLLRRLS